MEKENLLRGQLANPGSPREMAKQTLWSVYVCVCILQLLYELAHLGGPEALGGQESLGGPESHLLSLFLPASLSGHLK